MNSKRMTLGECISLCIDHRGKTPKKLGSDWSSTGYRALSAKNVKTGKIVQEDTIRFVDENLYRKWMPDEIRRGDILVTSEAPFGQIFLWDTDEKIVLSQRLFGIRPNPVICNPGYLYYWMIGHQFQEEMRGRATGTTVIGLRQPELLKCSVQLPSLDKQAAISACLRTIDEKIDINARLNDYLAELLLALQKQIAETEELTESRADEVFNIHIGKTPPRKEPEWFSFDRDGNVIWMSIKDMGGGDAYLIDSSEYLTPEAVDKHNIKKCKPGSVLLSFKLTVGRVGIVASEMVTNEAIACFSSDDPRKLAYLYPLLKSYDYASLGSTSSIATAVNSKMIKAMGLKIPSSSVLDAFYERAKPIYELLLSNTRELAALNELRDTLLPKLMSGEIDVSKVDLTQLNNHLA